MNILVPCKVDTVVLIRSSSAITLAAINTWMGDRLGRKINIHTQTCVCRNLYYSGLPLNIYRPKYLFQLKLCFQLKESISNYNLLLNIPKTLKYTYDTNWWCAVYRELVSFSRLFDHQNRSQL